MCSGISSLGQILDSNPNGLHAFQSGSFGEVTRKLEAWLRELIEGARWSPTRD